MRHVSQAVAMKAPSTFPASIPGPIRPSSLRRKTYPRTSDIWVSFEGANTITIRLNVVCEIVVDDSGIWEFPPAIVVIMRICGERANGHL
jgi:hypothetical protein